MATLLDVGPRNQEWTKGQDPGEGLNSLFRFDYCQGYGRCFVYNSGIHIYIHVTQPVVEFNVVRGCLIIN